MALPRLVVVGGNGFIGSAICRSALARGMQVTSVSSSGRPYQTPRGHTPPWTEKAGVVHTLGILLEDQGYKRAVRDADAPALLRAFFADRNPLAPAHNHLRSDQPRRGYHGALRVCAAFLDSAPPSSAVRRPFVFISAADVFRPWISARYVQTKRAAERGIAQLLAPHPDRFRGVFLRPGLVYHAHHRPLTTPAAALLDLTSTVHAALPDVLRGSLRAAVSQLPGRAEETPSPAVSVANALTTPPMHVDHVANAAVAACLNPEIHGVLEVKQMRETIGWRRPSAEGDVSAQGV
ncbi:hypothetical protein B0H14DRAFT_3078991 [Mycena olivaceomarginata]|nr:hypothetical protein B0H14DRAFT_3078991 [Mycena olivaceomarginata]